MENSEITYVYIMGRAHSGTTVLDCLLDNVDGIQGCGELVVGLPRLSETNNDTLPPGSFPFWDQVRQKYNSTDNDLSWSEAVQQFYEQAHITNMPNTWLTSSESEYANETKKAIEAIVDAITRTSGNDYIVDSSKELTRATFLARFFPNVKLIHLVRNPEHVVASTLHRIRDRHGFRFLRRNFKSDLLEPLFVTISCLGWLIGNLICEVIKYNYPQKSITVRYEDISDNNRDEIQKIGNHIKKDISQIHNIIKEQKNISTGQKVSGNKLLEKESFIFDTKRESRGLPTIYKILCKVISLPLMVKYEYASLPFENRGKQSNLPSS